VNERPVLLFDVFSLLYRAFFALPPMNTVKGEPTSALYGFSALLLKMLREEHPVGAAFAMDRPGNFRRQAFAGYKASRAPAPTPLGRQVMRVSDILEALGFPILGATGYEADDVLATLARALRAEGTPALVVSGDLDLLQCAVGSTRVFAVGRGKGQGRRYDEAEVWARYGVAPAELPDWKALAGDVTDEIPGVPGVGAKTASALVRRFGGVAGLLARIEEVEPEALRQAIAGLQRELPLWRELVRLRDDVPLPTGSRWAALTEPARARTRTLFEALEFRSLLPRLDALPVASG
jgi:DNA polymerase-1